MMRVHVINDPDLSPEQFHVSAETVGRVAARRGYNSADVVVTASLGATDLVAVAGEAEIVIGWSFPRDIAQQLPRLRWIHVIGAGLEHLEPLDWLPPRVMLTNSSGVHVDRAGEFLGCALQMLNSFLPRHVTNQRRRVWAPRYSGLIIGKTVTVVGVGVIGGEAARRAQELGLHVRGVRRTPEPHEYVDRIYPTERLHAALRGADYVVVTAPSTPQTRGLIGAVELDLLAEEAGLINVSRAALVDMVALAARLESGRLSGAIVDVFDPEPLPSDSPLWETPNLIVTPHISCDPLHYGNHMLEIFFDLAEQRERGLPMRNLVARPGAALSSPKDV